MTRQIIVDKNNYTATADKVPAFPWVRMDAGRFVWEEVLFEGNYLNVYHSAMGRCQSKDQVYSKLKSRKFFKNHMYSFELEIDGTLVRDYWKWHSEEVTVTPQGFHKLTVTLSHDILPVTVLIHTLLDGSSFIERWLEIKNEGNKPFAVSRVYPWCGIIAEEEKGCSITTKEEKRCRVGRFKNNTVLMEGEFEWMDLHEGCYREEILKRHHNPPMYVVNNEETGEMTVIHFEWTGNTAIEFTYAYQPEVIRDNCPWKGKYLNVRVGLAGPAPHRIVEPGEKVVTPHVHVAMLYGDMDTCVNALYKHLRKSVVPAQPPHLMHPVEYNHTGYTVNGQISKQLLLNEVDVAFETGCELFVVDAGWYGAVGDVWHEAVGDWYENPLLEGGLREVFNYARTKGMKCGIWMELERAGAKSEFAKNHSDWFCVSGGKKLEILDITKPEVYQYLYRMVEGIIKTYEIDCFRIDYNVDMFTGGERVADFRIENTNWKYYESLYAFFEQLQQQFPGLILENCSSGGGRIDLGMMRRFHWTQISDNFHPAEQLRILNGMTLALPPEQCMPIIGAINMWPSDMEFAVRAGLFGHFCVSGVFPSAEKINAEAIKSWRHAVEIYKNEVRPILSKCNVYHHTPMQNYSEKGEWVVLEYAEEEGGKAIVGVFRLPDSKNSEYRFVAKGLNVTKNYTVTFDNLQSGLQISGMQLCSQGLAVRIPGTMMSELLIIKEI